MNEFDYVAWPEAEALGYDISLEYVTPDLAQIYLKLNTHNRKLNQFSVARYTRSMENGTWLFNGAPIVFGSNDVLLDGQNRLNAIVRSGVSQPMVVVRGLKPEVQLDMDTNRPRTFGQQLSLLGIRDANAKAAIVEKMIFWEYTNGDLTGTSGRSASLTFSIAEKVEKFYELLWIEDDFSIIRKIVQTSPLTPSGAGLAWGVLSHIDREDATFFFEKLGTGANLKEGSPILALREGLQKLQATGLNDLGVRHMTALVFMAWNKYRNGENDVQFLRYKPGGANPSKFPVPR